MAVLDEMLTVAQVADVLGISSWSVRRLLRLGKLKGKKFAGQWRISPTNLDEYVKKEITGEN